MPHLNWRLQETLDTDIEIAAHALCVRTAMPSFHPEKFIRFQLQETYRFLFQNVAVSGFFRWYIKRKSRGLCSTFFFGGGEDEEILRIVPSPMIVRQL